MQLVPVNEQRVGVSLELNRIRVRQYNLTECGATLRKR